MKYPPLSPESVENAVNIPVKCFILERIVNIIGKTDIPLKNPNHNVVTYLDDRIKYFCFIKYALYLIKLTFFISVMTHLRCFFQDSGVSHYLAQWSDTEGKTTTGRMKVYGAGVRNKWSGEVNALAKLGTDTSPHVVTYLWATPENKLAPTIQAHTGDIVSTQARCVYCPIHNAS